VKEEVCQIVEKLANIEPNVKNEAKNYRKFFENYVKYIRTRPLLESDEEFDNAFNTLFYGKENEFINQATNFILNKLQISPESSLGQRVASVMSSIPKEDAKLAADPMYVAEKITNVLPQSFIEISQDGDQGLESIVKNELAKVASSKSTVDNIKFEVAEKIKDSLQKMKDNMKTSSQEMKTSYLEKLRNLG
jgi:DNA anti-recombination protein RmuC